jgi:hypothetical protein
MTNGIGRVGIRTYISPTPTIWNTLTNYYTFDSTPNDAKGGANGTLINGLGYSPAKINNGLNFDGINDSFSLPDNVFKPSGDFSVSFWIKLSTTNICFALDIGGAQSGFGSGLVIYAPSGSNSFRLYSGFAIVVFGTLATNTWYHLVLTHKQSTNYKAYLNGSLVNNTSISHNITFPTTTTYGAFGTAKNGPSTYDYFSQMQGDELAFFNSELTSTQVTELYNSGNGKQYPN